MKAATYTLPVKLPSVEEFAAKYRAYGGYANTGGRFLFDTIVSPEGYNFARSVTLVFGLPAVAGIAKMVDDAVNAQGTVKWDNYLRQYIGAVVCMLMESNGFQKTGVKRSIPHRRFTKGEVYSLRTK